MKTQKFLIKCLAILSLSAVAQASQFDFKVESISLQTAVAGEKTACTVRVKNSGKVAGTLLHVRLFAAKNVLDDRQFSCISITIADPSIQSVQVTQQTLLPNQSLDVDFFVVFKKAGIFSLTASAVPQNDSNPANNTLQISVNVSSPKPVICSFSATTVKPGDRFEIRGNWFTTLPNLAQAKVNIGPHIAQIDSLTPTAFWATVPCQGFSGLQKVTVTTSAGYGGKTITINNPAPSIVSLNPATPVVGKKLAITVSNLNTKCKYQVMLGGQKLVIARVVNSSLGPVNQTVLHLVVPGNIPAGKKKTLFVKSVGGQDTKIVPIL